MTSLPPVPDDPLISVLMPVFNVERFADEAIASVRAQTYCRWELIVVDDGSTDGTAAVVERHVAADDRVRLVRMPANGGVVAARNVALKLATGPLVAWIDGDDVAMPDRLERQLAALRDHPDVALVGCSEIGIDEHGRALRERWLPAAPAAIAAQLPFTAAVRNYFLCHRALYDRLGFYRFPGAEDYDFFLRVHDAGFRMMNIPGYIGMKVRLRGDNSGDRFGLRQRLLTQYVLYLHRRRAAGLAEEHNDAALARHLARPRPIRAWLYRTATTAMRRIQAGPAPARLARPLGFVVAAVISPDYARHFIRELRAKLA